MILFTAANSCKMSYVVINQNTINSCSHVLIMLEQEKVCEALFNFGSSNILLRHMTKQIQKKRKKTYIHISG
jgi:hypothetical protein